MKKFNKYLAATALVLTLAFGLAWPTKAHAATSPTLTDAASYSVLGGQAVTCTGSSTTTGDVGVSPGSSITGFPSCIAAGDNATRTHIGGSVSADSAQADRLIAYGVLDAGANADAECIGGNLGVAKDLSLMGSLVPGLYCATSFIMTGNLTLTGTTGVWVFKAATTLVTSSDSSVTGGDPCNVWWRIGSAATLGAGTSFIGNIVTGNVDDETALLAGATVNGRVLGGDASTISLIGNTISGPVCTPTPGSTTSGSTTSGSTTPGLPSTGTSSQSKGYSSPEVIIPAGLFVLLASSYLVRKKQSI